jgi:hypothetical protein
LKVSKSYVVIREKEIKMRTLVKSYWVDNENEEGAPEKRIIHGKYFSFNSVQVSLTVCFGLATGYFKCGSESNIDWIEDADVFIYDNKNWEKAFTVKGLNKPKSGEVFSYKIEKPCKALFVSIRKSGVDGYPPCYNLANTAIGIVGAAENSPLRAVRKLHSVDCKVDADVLLKSGIAYNATSVTAKYITRYYSVGFKLKSTGLNFLSCDGEGLKNTHKNVLAADSLILAGRDDYPAQGIIIDAYDTDGNCGHMQYNIDGKTIVRDNKVTYELYHEQTGQQITLSFTMLEKSIILEAARNVTEDIRLFDSCLLRLAVDSKQSSLTALAGLIKEGETGKLALPATLHMPGISNIVVSGDGMTLRFNSIRSLNLENIDFQLGEEADINGGYLLKKGSYHAKTELTFGCEHHIIFREHTPDSVKRAAAKYLYSALTYRADLGSFTNNGNSMGAPLCMDNWSAVCEALGNGINGVNSFEFLKNTIEVHLPTPLHMPQECIRQATINTKMNIS